MGGTLSVGLNEVDGKVGSEVGNAVDFGVVLVVAVDVFVVVVVVVDDVVVVGLVVEVVGGALVGTSCVGAVLG